MCNAKASGSGSFFFFLEEGIPVDLLVDIEDRYERLTPNRANGDRKTDLALTDQIDDPFDICSMQRKIPNDDIGLELGLALEKSIKFHSQANQMKGQSKGNNPICKMYNHTNLLYQRS